jgi:hypothetical protein
MFQGGNMNARTLTQSVPIFVILSVAGIGMAAFGLGLPSAEATTALIVAGATIFAAALADFMLGLGPRLSLPRRAVVFVALTLAGFVLAFASLQVPDPQAARLVVPIAAALFGASLVYFLAGRRIQD